MPTMRETLRVIAAWIELPHPPEPRAAMEFAAAIRTLATRMDDEERDANVLEWSLGKNHAAQRLLARLDAPVTP